jgi:hypothetical protein
MGQVDGTNAVSLPIFCTLKHVSIKSSLESVAIKQQD